LLKYLKLTLEEIIIDKNPLIWLIHLKITQNFRLTLNVRHLKKYQVQNFEEIPVPLIYMIKILKQELSKSSLYDNPLRSSQMFT
jgi:hypothetical protein